jgi:Tfp pilus assembly protein PilX
MEGNLRGARESLVVSPTSNTMRRSPEVSLHINTARERDRRLYAGLGPIPPRTHPHRTSPRSPKIGSPGHARGQSETSVPLPFSSPSYMTKMATNQRASSAIGHTSGPWSPEGYGQGRFPIKESRSLEVVREPLATTASHDKQYPVRSTSRMNSRSPSALETLQEDEDSPRNNRPTSAAGGLRDQMESLKGRLSSLKVRAQEDQLRRKSMQSLRTPSPFTNAQEWYSGLETRQTEGVPVTANAGLGINCESPTRKHLFAEDEDRPHTSGTTRSQREGEKLIGQPLTIQTDMDQDNLDGAEDNVFDELVAYDDDGDLGETDERDLASVNGDEPDSVYEDAVYEMPTTERHEDRVDAFDYENFFLHSAMGTYSMENRRSSTASDSSTATTRPVTALQDQEEELSTSEKRISFHARNQSANSISTIATFATAAENQSDDEEENEQMDHFSQQILSQQQVNASRPAASTWTSSIRSDSAINMRHGKGPSPIPTAISRSSATSGDLASGMQVSKIFSILTEASSPSHNEPTLALNEAEKQLIYSLAVSFQQVCANLQHTYGEQYERKAWRRRLDEARQVLNGEEIEDDQSF